MTCESRFVPGIFNYCDYWCERCAFTRRCRNFAMGREMEQDASGGKLVEDAIHAQFWNRLAEKLRETTVFGPSSEWTNKCENDFDDEPDPKWEAREDARRKTVRRHALSLLAEEYMKQAGVWLKVADADLKTVATELLDAAANPFTREDVEEQALQIGETIEVIGWYHTFIPAKVRRAVRGLLESSDTEGNHIALLSEVRLYDANGSGKVALVAIERSIGAWLHLREVLPRHESEVLRLLALLDRMRQGIHAALPGAQAFRRPGFDGEPEEG